MWDWLNDSTAVELDVRPTEIALRTVVALGVGLAIAGFYRLSHGRRKESAGVLLVTLVLLSTLIALVSMVIGNSVGRAFTLVGALSIVRFRTIVDDTRDTAFVIFAVVMGMAAGAGMVWLPVFGAMAVGVTAVALDRFVRDGLAASAAPIELVVRVPLKDDLAAAVSETIARHADAVRFRGSSTAKQGAALEIVYRANLRDNGGMPKLVTELANIPGVTSVDAKSL